MAAETELERLEQELGFIVVGAVRFDPRGLWRLRRRHAAVAAHAGPPALGGPAVDQSLT